MMASILLADDDGATRDLVKRALETDAHQVVVVADGAAAIEFLRSGSPVDVLVTDINMPVVDGITLAREAVKTYQKIRVLMISGLEDQLAKAGDIGASKIDTLVKPFSLEVVRNKVRALLD
jgi:two-component system, cell cycle response regulator CpdR